MLQGEVAGDYSGHSVSGVGDINGDGIEDLVIGAPVASPSARPYAGKSYVVWGLSNQQGGVLSLNQGQRAQLGADLLGVRDAGKLLAGTYSIGNVTRGQFELIWKNPPGQSIPRFTMQQLVSGEVFFIHDGSDAAPSYRLGLEVAMGYSFGLTAQINFTGLQQHQYNAVVDLSAVIDSKHAFALQGETAGDRSGISVSGAGDINGDGMEDLVIGAPYASPSARRYYAGKSYVVFGTRNVSAWQNGLLDLGSLSDGRRGFVLQGETVWDGSGGSVSCAGDINGDGVADLVIGAYYASPSGRPYAGKSYVVFGSKNVSAWGDGLLDLSSLHDGYRGFVLKARPQMMPVACQ